MSGRVEVRDIPGKPGSFGVGGGAPGNGAGWMAAPGGGLGTARFGWALMIFL